jgi:hypothetical protein
MTNIGELCASVVSLSSDQRVLSCQIVAFISSERKLKFRVEDVYSEGVIGPSERCLLYRQRRPDSWFREIPYRFDRTKHIGSSPNVGSGLDILFNR